MFRSQSCVMSRSVNINLELLTAIVKLKKQPRLALLYIADKSLVTAICECALNILNGNIPITRAEKTKLSREKYFIRSLAGSRCSWKSKRHLIVGKSDTVIPLIIDLALRTLKNESREEDGIDFA